MKKDPTQFRERFKRWKEGEQVYEAGLPKYEDGKLPKYADGLTPYNKRDVNTNQALYNSEEDLYSPRYTLPEVTITGTNKRPHTHAPIHLSKNAYKMQTGDLLGAMTTGMNVLSPSLWYGAVRDGDGIQDVFNKLMRGNSGFVTENFEKTHPYISLSTNLVGDGLLINAASKSANLVRALDRSFINNKNILNLGENTMTRYIGTGDSGYKDALVNDIIRGNPTPPRFNAHDLSKLRKKFGSKISESDFRDLASNNIRSEEQFNRINQVLTEGSSKISHGGISIGKNYSLGDSFQDYLNKKLLSLNQTAREAWFAARTKSPEINSWIKNWQINSDPNFPKGHSLPTFALSKEKLSNNLEFPGDFAVQINGADKYGRTATVLGHYPEHVVTYRPMSPFENDVNMFIRKDGLLTGHKYMVKIPKSKMAADRLKYLQNKDYSVNPTLRKGIGIDYNKLMNINTSDINLLNVPILTSDLIDYETRHQR